MENVPVIDVESLKLTVLEAVAKVEIELETLKLSGVNYIKVVHGYGSKGVGGAIKKAVLLRLNELKKHKKIKDFFACEAFSFTQKNSNFYAKKYPNLMVDVDIKTKNFGTTIVFL